MRFMRKFSRFLLVVIFCTGCSLRGYYVNLTGDGVDQAIDEVRQAILTNGFKKLDQPDSRFEDYEKDIQKLKPSFFGGSAYQVRIQIHFYQGEDGPFEIEIYNAYEGADPEVKQCLVEVADSLDRAIKQVIPSINIKRTEGRTGIPII